MKAHLLLLPCLLALSATAAPPPPREAVSAVADAIEERYFDPARATALAAELRAEAAHGDYDGLVEPVELATRLTERLRPADGHFRVNYAPPAAGQAAQVGTPQRRPPPDRGNYGFRRIEILPGNVALIGLGELADIRFGDAADPARAAADAALALTRHAEALIIDLRASPGGSPAMVGYLVSAFTERDADIYNRFRTRTAEFSESPREYYPAPRLGQPLYVLTSRRSASAAEALAYTLQSAGRAQVIGERSAGGANPGGLFEVGGGYAVFVSTGSPVNPITGRNWEGTGVQPDRPCAAAEALDVAHALALEALLAQASTPVVATERRWALQALRPAYAPPDISVYIGTYVGADVTLAGGRLQIDRPDRPQLQLRAVAQDEFALESDSGVHARFVRDEGGTISAFELLTPAGAVSRHARLETPGS